MVWMLVVLCNAGKFPAISHSPVQEILLICKADHVEGNPVV
jgi:hypothetical protein